MLALGALNQQAMLVRRQSIMHMVTVGSAWVMEKTMKKLRQGSSQQFLLFACALQLYFFSCQKHLLTFPRNCPGHMKGVGQAVDTSRFIQ